MKIEVGCSAAEFLFGVKGRLSDEIGVSSVIVPKIYSSDVILPIRRFAQILSSAASREGLR